MLLIEADSEKEGVMGLMEVKEVHLGLWQSLDIQKISDECVPCSTLKPGQVEGNDWLLATCHKAKNCMN